MKADPAPPLIDICEVPAGRYFIGDDRLQSARPLHALHLAAFGIGRTAVTNKQYAAFVAAGGYRDDSFWSAAGARWLAQKRPAGPAFRNEPAFNQPEQPAVGLCWYEAEAFARWLAHNTGQAWRLPTEAEWEAAARGPQGHAWPGSHRPVAGLINSAEQGLGHPWPAGGRGGLSWCGACDMSGNVWEWCASRWGRNWQTLEYPYPYDPNDGREDLSGTHARIIRGGSWFDPLPEAAPANRGRYLPGSRGSNIGLRLARDL